MLKSSDNANPEQIRNSLFLCVRSVRQMTEQLVTIVASLNDGNINESYISKNNINQEIHNCPHKRKTDQISYEDLTGESVCSIAEYNSLETSSKNDAFSSRSCFNDVPQWANFNNPIYESSYDSNIQCHMPKKYKYKILNKVSNDMKNQDLLINTGSQTFEENSKIENNFTSPDKFTQTSLVKNLTDSFNKKIKPKTVIDDDKLDLFTTQTIQTDPLIDFYKTTPLTIQDDHGKSWHGENVSHSPKMDKNPSNKVTNKFQTIKSKTIDQVELDCQLFHYVKHDNKSENVNQTFDFLIPNENEGNQHSCFDRKLLEKLNNYEPNNVLKNKSNSSNQNCLNNETKITEDIKNLENNFIQCLNLIEIDNYNENKNGLLTENNSILFGSSVSKINIELEDRNSKIIEETDSNKNLMNENIIQDLSFYDQTSNIYNSDFSVIEKTVSAMPQSSEFISDISIYNSRSIISNSNLDLLNLSPLDSIESASKVTSPSQSLTDFDSNFSAFSNIDLSMDKISACDSYSCSQSSQSNSKLLIRNEKIFSYESSLEKYLSHTNNIKYKTINTTNCIINNWNQGFDNSNNIHLINNSDENSSSMKDVSTLSGESITQDKNINQKSCNITQIFIERSESKLDLEIVLPVELNKSNSNSANSCSWKTNRKIEKIAVKSKRSLMDFEKKINSLESDKNKENITLSEIPENKIKINNLKTYTKDYLDNLDEFPNQMFTSCIEDCSNLSDCLTVARKDKNDSLLESNNDETVIYDVVVVDFEKYVLKQTYKTPEPYKPHFFKTYENESSLNTKSETVFLQATLPIAETSSKNSYSKNFKIKIDPNKTFIENDDKTLNQISLSDNLNLSNNLSCFNDNFNLTEKTKDLSPNKINKKTNYRKNKQINKLSIFGKRITNQTDRNDVRIKKRHSKNKYFPQSDSIIECFLDNL